MRIGITILGSGSKGNAFLIHTDTEGILVDVGFSRRMLFDRIAEVGLSPEIIKAILVTHEHADHVRGLRVVADSLKIPVYASIETAKYLKENNKTGEKNILFDCSTTFSIGNFDIQPFAIPHDSMGPVGFVVGYDDFHCGIATDLGHIPQLVQHRLHDCDAIIFESNHDVAMLRESNRPLHLKRRILGRHGHLDNETATEALATLITGKTRAVMLSHLSEECNNPLLVKKIAEQKLAELGREDILLNIAMQDRPLETVWLG